MKTILTTIALGLFVMACGHAPPKVMWCEYPGRVEGTVCMMELEDGSCYIADCGEGLCNIAENNEGACELELE